MFLLRAYSELKNALVLFASLKGQKARISRWCFADATVPALNILMASRIPSVLEYNVDAVHLISRVLQ